MAIRVAWSLATLLGLATPASAGDCRLALVLALDVSSSVNATEHHLQRQGLARALLAPEVMLAFRAGDPVALHAFEWSGPPFQRSLLPGWTMVDSEEDLVLLAATLLSTPRSGTDARNQSTGLGSALRYAARLLEDAPACRARTVDVSGDGANNAGIEPWTAYERDDFEGVTVNALVIGGADDYTVGHSGLPHNTATLIAWFEAEVLHGPGAFAILADGYEDFERAMAAKLQRELTPLLAGTGPPWLVLAEGSMN